MPELYHAEKEEVPVKKEGAHAHPLSAFCYKPQSAHFETQDSKEQVILLLRRHPITNLSWMSLVVVMVFAPVFFSLIPFWAEFPGRFQVASTVLWYFLTLAITLQGALTWFFNVNIITNTRIVDVDFLTLIYREISDAQIEKIQEVTYKVAGLGGTFFNYGNVNIQTAGAVPNFVFEDVPEPAHVVQILQELEGEGKEI